MNIFNHITKVGLVLVLLFSCNKEIDPKLMLAERYFVFGEVGTDLVYLTVWDLEQKRYLNQTDCKLIISANSTEFPLTFRKQNFWDSLPLSPGQVYEVILRIDGKETRLAGQLPKSEETIAIETEPYGEYANKFSMKVEGRQEPGEIYYRAYKNLPFMYLDDLLYTPGHFWSYTSRDSFLENQETFFYDAHKRLPIINIVENRTYNLTCKKIKSKNLLHSLLKYNYDLVVNEGNPLFVQYPFEEDVVMGDVVFRVLETTSLTSIPAVIKDTSRVLIEVYLYDKDGLPLTDFQQRYTSFSIEDRPNGNRTRRKEYVGNPVEITFADLAAISSTLPMTENELRSKILDNEIFISAGTRLNSPTGDIIKANESLMIESFDTIYKIGLRLK